MLYGRGLYSQAVMPRRVQKQAERPAAHLPDTTVEEDVAMLLRLCLVAFLAVSAAAVLIALAQ